MEAYIFDDLRENYIMEAYIFDDLRENIVKYSTSFVTGYVFLTFCMSFYIILNDMLIFGPNTQYLDSIHKLSALECTNSCHFGWLGLLPI